MELKNGNILEVFDLKELPIIESTNLKYFICIGGEKNYQCFLASNSLSRSEFMKHYGEQIDPCLQPIFEDLEIEVRQDAVMAVPGFYIVTTKKYYKRLSDMPLEVYRRCMIVVSCVKKALENLFGLKDIFVYYDEHYNKPSVAHFWVLPIHKDMVSKYDLKMSITSKDIWRYQELFKYQYTKDEILLFNEKIREYLAAIIEKQ